ncbi:MAG: sodium-dependent transporter [Ignavibacteriae bacterium]|nr:sodium-dependent transporter [Ignavibacteriota bacterium]
MTEQKERWGTRIGLILAAAGNAIGIGNLLRFPAQAGQNGGGAFMIPYVVSLLLFGLPLMWIAWTIGRYGGRLGHSSLPGMFDKMWNRPIGKYLGVLGLGLPMVFCLYYTYIEAWCLAYAYFSSTGQYISTPGSSVDLAVFYNEFLGNATSHSYFPSVYTALFFLIITILLNVWVLARGIVKGIELLAKIAIPLLVLFCIILVVRVLTLGTIEGSAWDGLAFLWTPDFSALANPNVWIAAAGQIFFTLSIGFGSLECYASYVREKEDIALAATTTAATNEFVEVIFGSMIAIPAAAIFFGSSQVQSIAQSGTFAIGMISMPEILRSFPGIQFFGTIWFLLLFFAAFTSSVAVCQPVMAFLQDEAKLKRGVAAAIVGLIWVLGTIPVIFFFKYGVFDEFDFWAGTIGLVVLAIVEVILFSWIFGLNKGWEELHVGALMRVPNFFKFIMKYVTPFALLAIFIGWASQARLTPNPRILWNVADRSNYSGKFQMDPPNDEVHQIQQSIYDEVNSANRDLTAWAEVNLQSDGNLQVTSYSADPHLEKVFDKSRFERWLKLQNFRYEVRENNGPPRMQAAQITIGLEALDRSPYIWLARIIIIGFFVVFFSMVAVIWKSRANGIKQGGVA